MVGFAPIFGGFGSGGQAGGGGGGAASGTLIVSGTIGGAAATAAWTRRALDTEEANTISGASLDNANDKVTLPAGAYDVDAYMMAWKGGNSNIRLRDLTAAATLLEGGAAFYSGTANYASPTIFCMGRISLAQTTELALEYYFSASGDLGNSAPSGSTRAVYLRFDKA